MKTRNLVLLVVLAGALISWAAWTLRPQLNAKASWKQRSLLSNKKIPSLESEGIF